MWFYVFDRVRIDAGKFSLPFTRLIKFALRNIASIQLLRPSYLRN